MTGINAFLFLTCQKAGEYVEKNLHSQLGFTGKLRLTAHLKMCRFCKNYSQQSQWLEGLIRQHQNHLEMHFPDPEMVSEVKQKALDKTGAG